MMTKRWFLDKLFLSLPPLSHVTFHHSISQNGESLLLTGPCVHWRQQQPSVNTHTLLQTLRRVTNTPITAPHITRCILDVTRINICLCYVLIMASQRAAFNCFIYHCLHAVLLALIACKLFKQMLHSCMQECVQELVFSGRRWKVCKECLCI